MRYFAFLILFALSACGIPDNPDEPYRLKNYHLKNLLSGNTLVDSFGGVEFHDPSGMSAYRRSKPKNRPVLEAGIWAIESDQICYKYPATGNQSHCWVVYKMPNGTLAQRFEDRENYQSITVGKGDPNGLRSQLTQSQVDRAAALR